MEHLVYSRRGTERYINLCDNDNFSSVLHAWTMLCQNIKLARQATLVKSISSGFATKPVLTYRFNLTNMYKVLETERLEMALVGPERCAGNEIKRRRIKGKLRLRI